MQGVPATALELPRRDYRLSLAMAPSHVALAGERTPSFDMTFHCLHGILHDDGEARTGWFKCRRLGDSECDKSSNAGPEQGRTESLLAHATSVGTQVACQHRIPQQRAKHDPQTQIGQVPTVLAQDRPKDWQTPEPGHVWFTSRRRETREGSSILQTKRLRARAFTSRKSPSPLL